MGTFAVSERRACAVVGQPRSTQRQQPRPRADEARLVARILELVRLHPRFGYRRVRALLVAELALDKQMLQEVVRGKS